MKNIFDGQSLHDLVERVQNYFLDFKKGAHEKVKKRAEGWSQSNRLLSVAEREFQNIISPSGNGILIVDVSRFSKKYNLPISGIDCRSSSPANIYVPVNEENWDYELLSGEFSQCKQISSGLIVNENILNSAKINGTKYNPQEKMKAVIWKG